MSILKQNTVLKNGRNIQIGWLARPVPRWETELFLSFSLIPLGNIKGEEISMVLHHFFTRANRFLIFLVLITIFFFNHHIMTSTFWVSHAMNICTGRTGVRQHTVCRAIWLPSINPILLCTAEENVLSVNPVYSSGGVVSLQNFPILHLHWKGDGI